MKLWRVQYHDDDSSSGTVEVWAGSLRAIKRRMSELTNDFTVNGKLTSSFMFYDDPYKVNVPTDKQGLIKFLNQVEL